MAKRSLVVKKATIKKLEVCSSGFALQNLHYILLWHKTGTQRLIKAEYCKNETIRKRRHHKRVARQQKRGRAIAIFANQEYRHFGPQECDVKEQAIRHTQLLMQPDEVLIHHPAEGEQRKCQTWAPVVDNSPTLAIGLRRYNGNFPAHQAEAIVA